MNFLPRSGRNKSGQNSLAAALLLKRGCPVIEAKVAEKRAFHWFSCELSRADCTKVYQSLMHIGVRKRHRPRCPSKSVRFFDFVRGGPDEFLRCLRDRLSAVVLFGLEYRIRSHL